MLYCNPTMAEIENWTDRELLRYWNLLQYGSNNPNRESHRQSLSQLLTKLGIKHQRCQNDVVVDGTVAILG